MTTLREQARRDAQACAHNDEYDAQYGADAASNLWEPVLRDLLSEIMDEITSGHLPSPSVKLWDAITRAKKALS